MIMIPNTLGKVMAMTNETCVNIRTLPIPLLDEPVNSDTIGFEGGEILIGDERFTPVVMGDPENEFVGLLHSDDGVPTPLFSYRGKISAWMWNDVWLVPTSEPKKVNY